MLQRKSLAAMAALALGLIGFGAHAARAELPHPWQLGLMPPASLTAERIYSFHQFVLWIITVVALFVLVLLIYVMWRFRASRNPVPSRTSHNTVIEVLWTVIPIMILVVIAIPSFKLLYYADKTHDAQLTLKATGHQWYWSYDYPDSKVSFDSMIVDDADLKPGQPRLLTVDHPVVLPINTNVRILVASDDVMHAWTLPSLGVNINAVPGRLNETWMNIVREGTYYGQCFQLCGVNHGFMPIEIHAVSKEAFAKWLADQKKAASNQRNHSGTAGTELAQAAAQH
ncbi:MAG TPA: cytochrome c oxidase subunit II [Alphaproteobacteria bacterium]|nr:cytochrome c oxidase subunit II [Alphaproteobacteria bacterium]